MSPSNDNRMETAQKLARAIPMLSPAEIRVCLLVIEGRSTRDIASALSLSERTIQNHRQSIRRKIKARASLMVELLRLLD